MQQAQEQPKQEQAGVNMKQGGISADSAQVTVGGAVHFGNSTTIVVGGGREVLKGLLYSGGAEEKGPADQFSKKLPVQPDDTVTRLTQIQALSAGFQKQMNSGKKQVQIIGGIYGVGKTQLAISYARLPEHQEKDFVAWIHADQGRLQSEWLEMGRSLGVSGLDKMSEQEWKTTIQDALYQRTSWLIVIDGADNEEAIKNLLPSSQKAGQQLLITTRSVSAWQYPVVTVPSFTPEQSREYFEHRKKLKGEELAQRLGHLPLALQDAVAQMGKAPAATFHKKYQREGVQLLPNVVEHCRFALAQLERKEQKAAELVKFCAYLDSKEIQIDSLKALVGMEEEDAQIYEYIAMGRDIGLLIQEEGDECVSMHCVVQEAIRHYESSTQVDVLNARLRPIAENLLKSNNAQQDRFHLEAVKKQVKILKDKEEQQDPQSASSLFKRISHHFNPEEAEAEAKQEMSEEIRRLRAQVAAEQTEKSRAKEASAATEVNQKSNVEQMEKEMQARIQAALAEERTKAAEERAKAEEKSAAKVEQLEKAHVKERAESAEKIRANQATAEQAEKRAQSAKAAEEADKTRAKKASAHMEASQKSAEQAQKWLQQAEKQAQKAKSAEEAEKAKAAQPQKATEEAEKTKVAQAQKAKGAQPQASRPAILQSNLEQKAEVAQVATPPEEPQQLYQLGREQCDRCRFTAAREYFERAAAEKYPPAYLWLYRLYRNNMVTKNAEQKAHWKKLASEQSVWFQGQATIGTAETQFNLAWCYETGTGVAKDPVEAVRLYRLAADQGHAAAQDNLGDCYRAGIGVAKDPVEAVRWYRLAADQEDACAQDNLGDCYRAGTGVAKDLQEAVRWYRLAADQGNKFAQTSLGFRYENGTGVAKDSVQAVRWYHLAAEQGHAPAQNSLGLCYANGTGVATDPVEAARWYRLAADQGNKFAQNNLGLCYANGTGVAKDPVEAVRLYRLAADQGNAFAQNRLGFCYQYGTGVAKDLAEAVRYYRLAADQGYAIAQTNLGLCYKNGTGVAKDPVKALCWYRLAADQGYAVAQKCLGVCYENGTGAAKDPVEALRWYRLAADQGDAAAQANLGLCYDNGTGVAKDPVKALCWYRLAADQGYAVAQKCLGVCYENGTGVAKDPVEALRWYRLAADQGDAAAQANLGLCYDNGTGVAKDPVEAVRWYRLAADQGHAVAKTNLDNLLKASPELAAVANQKAAQAKPSQAAAIAKQGLMPAPAADESKGGQPKVLPANARQPNF